MAKPRCFEASEQYCEVCGRCAKVETLFTFYENDRRAFWKNILLLEKQANSYGISFDWVQADAEEKCGICNQPAQQTLIVNDRTFASVCDHKHKIQGGR